MSAYMRRPALERPNHWMCYSTNRGVTYRKHKVCCCKAKKKKISFKKPLTCVYYTVNLLWVLLPRIKPMLFFLFQTSWSTLNPHKQTHMHRAQLEVYLSQSQATRPGMKGLHIRPGWETPGDCPSVCSHLSNLALHVQFGQVASWHHNAENNSKKVHLVLSCQYATVQSIRDKKERRKKN